MDHAQSKSQLDNDEYVRHELLDRACCAADAFGIHVMEHEGITEARRVWGEAECDDVKRLASEAEDALLRLYNKLAELHLGD